MILINIIFFFLLPFQMSFNFFFFEFYLKENESLNQFIAFLIIIIFSSDMFLKFFTGFYKDGIVVLKLEKVVKKYLFSGLIFDLIALLPIFLNVILALYPENIRNLREFVKYSGFLFFFRFLEVYKFFFLK